MTVSSKDINNIRNRNDRYDLTNIIAKKRTDIDERINYESKGESKRQLLPHKEESVFSKQS